MIGKIVGRSQVKVFQDNTENQRAAESSKATVERQVQEQVQGWSGVLVAKVSHRVFVLELRFGWGVEAKAGKAAVSTLWELYTCRLPVLCTLLVFQWPRRSLRRRRWPLTRSTNRHKVSFWVSGNGVDKTWKQA